MSSVSNVEVGVCGLLFGVSLATAVGALPKKPDKLLALRTRFLPSATSASSAPAALGVPLGSTKAILGVGLLVRDGSGEDTD
jgi:hypothetical protein